jgi:acyl carrier protein
VAHDRAEVIKDLKSFLKSLQRPGRDIEIASDDEVLVAGGYIDSLAVVQIVMHLESKYQVDFSKLGLDPERLSTVSDMADLVLEANS